MSSWYCISYWWELTRPRWARFAEARNVRAGGADPPRSRRNTEFRPPIAEGIQFLPDHPRDPIPMAARRPLTGGAYRA